MKIEDIYKALSEPDRLRILNLLAEGPLCGCFIQEIMEVCQVKVSKQLGYLKKMSLVESIRNANWMVYRLAEPVPPLLAENIRMMRGSDGGHNILNSDLEQRRLLMERVAKGEKTAPQTVRKKCCLFGRRCD
jgi:ArsR family transcriptional regulator